MQDLPLEVWALVAQKIPPQELAKLLTVNSAFLNLALDARYRTIEWAMLDRKFIRFLKRLQDPSIARRVRRLHIRPWFIQYLFQREELYRTSFLNEEHERKKTWSYTFTQLLGYFDSPEAEPSRVNIPRPSLGGSILHPPPKELVRSMIQAVKGMVNVTEYEFQWRDMPINPETLSFLSSTRAAFHANLSKLVIHSRLSRFDQILSFTKFSGLSELELHFDYDPSTEADIGKTNEKILIAFVVPFMNGLRSTLHSLTIASAARGDHSAFLRELGPLPILRSLSLRMSMSSEFFSDPSVIRDLLQRHRSFLTRLAIRLDGGDGPIKALTAWPLVGDACMADLSWLSNLESLEFPAPHMPTMSMLIHRAPMHLTRLCLFGRYLEETEVATVVGLLGPRVGLRSLSLDVKRINPELFTLLANTLPGLLSLTLVVGSSPYDYGPLHFHDANRKYTIQPNWKLYDLSVYFDYPKDDSVQNYTTKLEHDTMSRLTTIVLPSVRSFKGHGDMRLFRGKQFEHPLSTQKDIIVPCPASFVLTQ